MSKMQFGAIAGAAILLAAQGAVAAPYQFGGFYAGGHFGYLDAQSEVNSDRNGDGGTMGGLQAGYNIIDGNMMYGVETDFSLTNADPSGNCNYITGGSCDFDLGAMATLRARAGYAVDDFLFFATGGIAAVRYDMRSFDAKGAQVDDLQTFGKFGFAVGAGVEYLLGDMMSVKLEYRYTQLRQADFESFQAPGETTIDMHFHTIMTGVNWHF